MENLTLPQIDCKAAGPPAHASGEASTEPLVVSLARIAPQANGSFVYDRSGSLALTLAVEDRHGDMVDVVAWGRDPLKWWLRRGDQTPILGSPALAEAAWHHEPALLWGTPEAWVQSHRPGGEADRSYCVTVLRWDVDLRPLFDGVPSVQCQTPSLARLLENALHQFDPEIEVFNMGARHAA